VLQGMGILYFALAANFWWLALCINVFEMVFLGRSLHVVRKWHLFYHIFAWGAPLLGVIIVLAGTVRLTNSTPPTPPITSHTRSVVLAGAQSFGALPAVPYCFVAGNEWWQWTIFYIPVVSCLIIGTILIIASVIRFVRVLTLSLSFSLSSLSANSRG
jgi:multisubunit Na+/H+ antiporter MnhC subunit